MSDNREIVEELSARPIALTTFRKKDEGSAIRYQTAIVRGDDELLFWGLGPRLAVGDLVALYVPDSQLVPRRDRKSISRVYSISQILKGEEWPNYVYLSQPLVFDHFCLGDLKRRVGITDFEIRDAGSKEHPWDRIRAKKFWSCIFERQPSLEMIARERLLKMHSSTRYDVAISYAGPDWTDARRLKRWLDHEPEGLHTFFATSVGELYREGAKALPQLLKSVYRNSRVAVFLTPPSNYKSKWINKEVQEARDGADQVIALRSETSRRWRLRDDPKVERIFYTPPHEKAIVKTICAHVRRLRRWTRSQE